MGQTKNEKVSYGVEPRFIDSNESNVESQGENDTTKTDVEINHVLERKVCRKLDFRILPMAAAMYLFNALDKGNISNAKTNGISNDLGITGDRWNIMLSIFYIPFVLCAFPISLIIKKYGAAIIIPCLMIIFGSTTLLAVSAFNFGSLMAARWFLGMAELAFLPGIIFYLTQFYRRAELARRLSIFYAAANIANAFSGLLSYGVFQIKGSKLHGWQILFLIEGSATVLVAVLAFLVLPKSIKNVKFFTEEERECALMRIDTDSSAKQVSGLSFKDAVKVFKHPVAILWMFQEFSLGVPLNSINNWFPQIIQLMGKSAVTTNLLTVAPNIWGALSLIILCFASDYFRVRSLFICIAIILTLIGFVVFAAIDVQTNIGASYFSCFLMTTGVSASSVLTSTWYNNNTPNENRRVVISAIGVPLANGAGLISTNIFRPKDAPKYILALGITAGFGGLGVIIVGTIVLYMLWDDRRKNKDQGVYKTYKDVPTSELAEGPNDPNFRWML